MKEHILIRYGQAVRKVRLEQGISQEELADRCGLHRTYISCLLYTSPSPRDS